MPIVFVLATQARAMSGEECRTRAEAADLVQAVAWRSEAAGRWRVGIDERTFDVLLPSEAGELIAVASLQSGETLAVPDPKPLSLDTDAEAALIQLVPNCGLGISGGPSLVASRVQILSGPDPSQHAEALEALASRWLRSRSARQTLGARPSRRSRATEVSMWWGDSGIHIRLVARARQLESAPCGVETDKPCSNRYVSRELSREWTRVVDPGGTIASEQLTEPRIESFDPSNPP